MDETITTSEPLEVLYTEPATVPIESTGSSDPTETTTETVVDTVPVTSETVPETTQEVFLEYDLEDIQETETQETVAVLVEVTQLEQYVSDLAHVQLYCSFLLAGVMAAIALFLRFGR